MLHESESLAQHVMLTPNLLNVIRHVLDVCRLSVEEVRLYATFEFKMEHILLRVACGKFLLINTVQKLSNGLRFELLSDVNFIFMTHRVYSV